MALINCNFYSKALGFETTMNVILPGDSKDNLDISSLNDKKIPVLYLLHGLSNNHSVWARRSSIDRYVRDHNIAVVMPDGGRSFYTNMKHGYDYYTFISEELPAMAELFFPVSDKREERFIAGVSMGGYGALKVALSKPDMFSKAASLSGATDIISIANKFKEDESMDFQGEFHNIFGSLDKFPNSNHDLFALAKKCSKQAIKPELFLTCGTEDFLYDDNVNFRNLLDTLNLDFTYDEGPGMHNWKYWDSKIQTIIKWIV